MLRFPEMRVMRDRETVANRSSSSVSFFGVRYTCERESVPEVIEKSEGSSVDGNKKTIFEKRICAWVFSNMKKLSNATLETRGMKDRSFVSVLIKEYGLDVWKYVGSVSEWCIPEKRVKEDAEGRF